MRLVLNFFQFHRFSSFLSVKIKQQFVCQKNGVTYGECPAQSLAHNNQFQFSQPKCSPERILAHEFLWEKILHHFSNLTVKFNTIWTLHKCLWWKKKLSRKQHKLTGPTSLPNFLSVHCSHSRFYVHYSMEIWKYLMSKSNR